MIVETSVLVVGNKEQSLVPFRALHHCLHDFADQMLTGCNIGRRSIVVVLTIRLVDEIRIDERYGRQRSRFRTGEKPFHGIIRIDDIAVVGRVALIQARVEEVVSRSPTSIAPY